MKGLDAVLPEGGLTVDEVGSGMGSMTNPFVARCMQHASHVCRSLCCTTDAPESGARGSPQSPDPHCAWRAAAPVAAPSLALAPGQHRAVQSSQQSLRYTAARPLRAGPVPPSAPAPLPAVFVRSPVAACRAAPAAAEAAASALAPAGRMTASHSCTVGCWAAPAATHNNPTEAETAHQTHARGCKTAVAVANSSLAEALKATPGRLQGCIRRVRGTVRRRSGPMGRPLAIIDCRSKDRAVRRLIRCGRRPRGR